MVCSIAQTQVNIQTANIIRALQQLRVGSDTSKYFTGATDTIIAANTHRQIPTARSVYLYGQALITGGGIPDGDKGDITVSGAGANWIIEAGAVTKAKIAANAVDSTKVATGALSVTDIGQHGAINGSVLKWNGTQWAATALHNYDLVTSSQTVSAALNQVFINTITANITLNLAPCNAANNGVRFEFVKVGSDSFAAIIEPSGVEEFIDGTTNKRLYSRGTSIACTCRWNGTSGVWLYASW